MVRRFVAMDTINWKKINYFKELVRKCVAEVTKNYDKEYP